MVTSLPCKLESWESSRKTVDGELDPLDGKISFGGNVSKRKEISDG